MKKFPDLYVPYLRGDHFGLLGYQLDRGFYDPAKDRPYLVRRLLSAPKVAPRPPSTPGRDPQPRLDLLGRGR